MKGVDAVGRLEGASGNIDGAVGDNWLSAKYGAKWFAVRVGERAEEGAERGLEHHQLTAIGNVVNDAVGDGDSGFGFTRHFAPPEKRPVLRIKGPQSEIRVFGIDENPALGNCRRANVDAGTTIPPNDVAIDGVQRVERDASDVDHAVSNRGRRHIGLRTELGPPSSE